MLRAIESPSKLWHVGQCTVHAEVIWRVRVRPDSFDLLQDSDIFPTQYDNTHERSWFDIFTPDPSECDEEQLLSNRVQSIMLKKEITGRLPRVVKARKEIFVARYEG